MAEMVQELKNARLAAGLSQSELAKLSGISISTISAIERGVAGCGSEETMGKLEYALALAANGQPEEPGKVKIDNIFKLGLGHVRYLNDTIVPDPEWGEGKGILVGWVNAPWLYLRPLPLIMALKVSAGELYALMDDWERDGMMLPGGLDRAVMVKFPDGNIHGGLIRVNLDKFREAIGD